MATFTLVASINQGDETTVPENLFFKVYDRGVLIHTTGTATDDPTVSIQSNEVIIVQIPSIGNPDPKLFTVTQVDEAKNESEQSNEIIIGVSQFYEVGFYEAGFYS